MPLEIIYCRNQIWEKVLHPWLSHKLSEDTDESWQQHKNVSGKLTRHFQ